MGGDRQDATACSLPRASGRGHPRPLRLPAGLRLETLVKDPGRLGDVRWPGEDAVEQRVEVRVAPGSFFGLGIGLGQRDEVHVAPAPHTRGGGPLKTWAHRAPVRLHPRRQLLLLPAVLHAGGTKANLQWQVGRDYKQTASKPVHFEFWYHSIGLF